MADILNSSFGQIIKRFRDMLDGTYAEVVSTVSANTGATADQVQGNVASGAADSGNPVKIGGKYNVALPTLVDGQRGDAQLTSHGAIRTFNTANSGTGSDGYGNSNIAFFGADGAPTGNYLLAIVPHVFNGTTWDRQVKPNSTSRLLSSAATTNGTSVKGAAGNLQKIICNNTVATDRFLKFYNKTIAPVVGTDTPVLTLTLPASTKNIQIDMGTLGQYFSTGIAYAITGLAADADTTAIAAGDITALNLTYS